MSDAQPEESSNYSVCWRGDSDCPECPSDKKCCFTSAFLLDCVFHHSLAEHFERAQKHYMIGDGIDRKDIKLQSPLIFHSYAPFLLST